MVGILVIGLVAGVIAGISPCILPVLPVVLVAGVTDPQGGEEPSGAARRRRSVAVVLGLVVSFSTATLAGSALLASLGLPDDALRDAGMAVLFLVGLGLLVPPIGHLVERPFARLSGHQPSGRGSGFVLGLALGLVFVPCAGPVLAAVTVVGATHRVSLWAVLLTVSFAVGAALPLLAVALAGDRVVLRSRALRERSRFLRPLGGAVLLVTAFLLATNLTQGLQRTVPGYTDALQRSVEGSAFAHRQLSSLTGEQASGALGDCDGDGTSPQLLRCGSAPPFRQVTAWLNTPGGRPLSERALLGHVVLVDFWTYSCINCQRSLPHVEAWYRRYRADGLIVVGVHTPEFAFEHVLANVRDAVHQLGVRYPVAVDDRYATWEAWFNEYWPEEYLLDQSSEVRHVYTGEGDYGAIERAIRVLLHRAHPGTPLPPPTDVPDRTPREPTNPETYLGYDRVEYLQGAAPVENRPASYAFPPSLVPGHVALAGTWTIGPESMTAGPGARMELAYQARDVYLVTGGAGTITEQVGDGPPRVLSLPGPPGLSTLLQGSALSRGTLQLSFSPGVRAYDFTFG